MSYPTTRFRCTWLLLAWCWFVGGTGVLLTAAEPAEVELPAKENFHLYLLIGQSNMAGRGKVEEEDKKPHPRVLMFTPAGKWAPATDPLHADKPTAGVGLGSAFGRAMAEANPEVTIGLVPCAVGGTQLARWLPGQDLYQQALKRAQAAQQVGTFQGILWHQGEADSAKAEDANSYAARLAAAIAGWRKDLNSAELPFVAGQLGEFFPATEIAQKFSFVAVVNQAIAALPEQVPRTGAVSSAGLQHKGDGTHFDSPSLREFGRRYAEQMLKLQGKKPAASNE